MPVGGAVVRWAHEFLRLYWLAGRKICILWLATHGDVCLRPTVFEMYTAVIINWCMLSTVAHMGYFRFFV